MTLTEELIAARFPEYPPDEPAPSQMLSRSDAELDALLEETLSREPDARANLWFFAYGAVMWRWSPDIEYAEKRVATISGLQRRFCLWQWRYRGTTQNPALMLALDEGGECEGVAYRIAGPDVADKIVRLWRIEMRHFAYHAQWHDAMTDGGLVRVLTFVINRENGRYASELDDESAADYIANACGHVGPCAEYLLKAVTSMEGLGLRDPMLWRMQRLVAERIRAALPDR